MEPEPMICGVHVTVKWSFFRCLYVVGIRNAQLFKLIIRTQSQSVKVLETCEILEK